ncbi:hypothetical protein [Protofrankia symbiont of Coriaria ruscifolia]|uniref:hypothetical protein n=1 Tax=Protofrankia symbiont of Coriaria ruscifolia TaxID=1306542 RepID=UPI0010410078|nr:hypothetical protein [Protofrankia symbiont of Coriaria ruscifolia]
MTTPMFVAVAALADADQPITLPSAHTIILLGLVLSGIALVSGRLMFAAFLAIVTVGFAGLASIAAAVFGSDDVTQSVSVSITMLAGLRLRRGAVAVIPPRWRHRFGRRRFRRQRPDSVPDGQTPCCAEEKPRRNSRF